MKDQHKYKVEKIIKERNNEFRINKKNIQNKYKN